MSLIARSLSFLQAEHEATVERLQAQSASAVRELRAAQEETDLKRETSKKLKEEIVDNDKLTVANLNRIKHLEALVEQHKAALDEAETENGELRTALAASTETAEEAKASEEKAESLRELLAERESQLLSMSRRLSDVLEAREAESYDSLQLRDPLRDPLREKRISPMSIGFRERLLRGDLASGA